MATFTERVSVLIDVAGEQAASKLSNFKTKVGEAEGSFGKLKAGAGAAFDAIGAMGPVAAAGAGVAVGKMVLELVGGFQDLALEANDFAQASGLGVEEASRWMEVAGDVGVNVGTLEGAINKMNLAAGKGDLAKLGIEGQTTGEQLLASLTHLQGIPDASTRATEGVKIFGKSWTNLAPLVESSKDLKQALADVSDAQAINPAEVEKAKKYRDAVDNLSDAWTSFKLGIGGELITGVTDLATALGNLEGAASDLTGAIPGLGSIGDILLHPFNDVSDGLATLTDSSKSLTDRARGLGQTITGAIPGPLGSWASGMFDVADSQDDAAEATKTATERAKEQADQAKETEDAIRSLTTAVLAQFSSQLQYEDAQGKTTKAIDSYVASAVEAGAAAGANTTLNDKYKQSMNDAEQAALAQASAAAKLAEDTAKASGEAFTAADQNAALRASLLDVANTLGPNDPLRAKLMGYITDLGKVEPKVHTEVTADTSQAEKAIANLMGSIRSFVLPHNTVLGASTSAAGYAAPAAAGPTATTTAAGATPTGATSSRRGVAAAQVVNVNYHAPPGVNPADVIRVLNRWTSTRGTPATTGATGL